MITTSLEASSKNPLCLSVAAFYFNVAFMVVPHLTLVLGRVVVVFSYSWICYNLALALGFFLQLPCVGAADPNLTRYWFWSGFLYVFFHHHKCFKLATITIDICLQKSKHTPNIIHEHIRSFRSKASYFGSWSHTAHQTNLL